MLENLFGSKTRVKILRLFFLDPEKKYYIRQLARELDLQVNSIRRELENLEEIGLLKSSFSTNKNDIVQPETDQNKEEGVLEDKSRNTVDSDDENTNVSIHSLRQEKKYFGINIDFILFDELKALIRKFQIVHRNDFIENVKKLINIDLLILSGVFTNIDADVDILIVGNPNKDVFLKLVEKFEKKIKKEINYTIIDKKEYNYRKEISDTFLKNILNNKKIILVDKLTIDSGKDT